MTLFVDSANLEDIAVVLKRGVVKGITTNPSLVSRERPQDYHAHVSRVLALAHRHGDVPVSVELTSTDPEIMKRQALTLADMSGLVIKVPIGWEHLPLMGELVRRGIRVNCTAIMSVAQAMLAAESGATYASLFWGRIRDGGESPHEAVTTTRQLLDRHMLRTKIIVGSIRSVQDVIDALMSGAHIVTVPPPFLPQMAEHPKTTEVVQQFMRDFEATQSLTASGVR